MKNKILILICILIIIGIIVFIFVNSKNSNKLIEYIPQEEISDEQMK